MEINIDSPMEVYIVPLEEIVIDVRARDWCKLSYPDHPKGCPNYGKKDGCPPSAPLWTDCVKPPYILVGIKFNLAKWARKLKEKHPEFSDRQTRCCLYWQGMVRKRLKEECEEIQFSYEINGYNLVIDYCPEAKGVHVFETCYKNGIKLHKNPQEFVWKIAIIGEKK